MGISRISKNPNMQRLPPYPLGLGPSLSFGLSLQSVKSSKDPKNAKHLKNSEKVRGLRTLGFKNEGS